MLYLAKARVRPFPNPSSAEFHDNDTRQTWSSLGKAAITGPSAVTTPFLYLVQDKWHLAKNSLPTFFSDYLCRVRYSAKKPSSGRINSTWKLMRDWTNINSCLRLCWGLESYIGKARAFARTELYSLRPKTNVALTSQETNAGNYMLKKINTYIT